MGGLANHKQCLRWHAVHQLIRWWANKKAPGKGGINAYNAVSNAMLESWDSRCIFNASHPEFVFGNNEE